MKEKLEEIKLLLHHNYLQINFEDNKLQLPIRAAKLIHDMYEVRQAENERKDIEHYTDEYNNYSYDIDVFLMNLKHSNILQWFTKKILPLKISKNGRK